MGFADLTSPDAVVEAIRECEQMREPAFLEKYGFGPTRHVRLLYDGMDYPAKAIIGVAHRFQFPDEGALEPSQFTSGESTINKLKQLGFSMEGESPTDAARLYVVRGGGNEEVVDYALENGVVATGWSELGDLSLLDDDAMRISASTTLSRNGSTSPQLDV
jgi:hypothetical protein